MTTTLRNAELNGVQTHFNAAADETLSEMKTAPGFFCSWDLVNPDAVGYFVQFFNLRAADVILGMTPPFWTLFVPAGDGMGVYGKEANALRYPVRFDTAITYAVTTTATGAIGPTTSIRFSATLS